MSLANLRPPPWTENAACHNQPTDPLTGAQLQPHHWDDHGTPAASRVCADCPVQLACAQHALTTAEPHGMWGGLNPRDRRRVAAAAGYLAPGTPPHGSRARYTHRTHPCRCRRCREANTRWKRGYVAQRRTADTRHPKISA